MFDLQKLDTPQLIILGLAVLILLTIWTSQNGAEGFMVPPKHWSERMATHWSPWWYYKKGLHPANPQVVHYDPRTHLFPKEALAKFVQPDPSETTITAQGTLINGAGVPYVSDEDAPQLGMTGTDLSNMGADAEEPEVGPNFMPDFIPQIGSIGPNGFTFLNVLFVVFVVVVIYNLLN